MNEPYRSPPDLLVLHTLRCIGAASIPRLETIVTEVADVEVEDELLRSAAAGLVRHLPGEFGGWHLTEKGRAHDVERVAAELDAAGARGAVRAAFDEFLTLNPRALDVCSAWQVRIEDGSVVSNDHHDGAYDRRVLDELAVLHADATPVCDRLAERLHRFSHHRPRLARALARAQAGDRQAVTDALDSFHSVWFQLHEDLLVTLGISRDT